MFMHLRRIGAALAAMASLVWLLWPEAEGWEINPEAFIGFFTAFGAWAYVELETFRAIREKPLANKVSHPHDVALFKKVHSDIVYSGTLAFLRDHNLGASFKQDLLTPLNVACVLWRGAEWEFEDDEVQEAFHRFLENTRRFVRSLSYRTTVVQEGLLSIVPQEERATDWFSEPTMKEVDQLNDLATEVANDFDNFVRIARKKLPEAFSSLAGSSEA